MLKQAQDKVVGMPLDKQLVFKYGFKRKNRQNLLKYWLQSGGRGGGGDKNDCDLLYLYRRILLMNRIATCQ